MIGSEKGYRRKNQKNSKRDDWDRPGGQKFLWRFSCDESIRGQGESQGKRREAESLREFSRTCTSFAQRLFALKGRSKEKKEAAKEDSCPKKGLKIRVGRGTWTIHTVGERNGHSSKRRKESRNFKNIGKGDSPNWREKNCAAASFSDGKDRGVGEYRRGGGSKAKKGAGRLVSRSHGACGWGRFPPNIA